jgi:intracellular septation protein A
MSVPEVYLASALVVLAIIALLIFWTRRKEYRISPLLGLSLAFVVAGIIFGNNRLVGYGLMIVGVILAVIEWVRWRRGGF